MEKTSIFGKNMPIFEPFFRQRRIIRRQITSIFSKILEKVLLILFAIIPIRCLLGKQSIVFDFIPHAGTQSEFFASFADSVVHPRRAARLRLPQVKSFRIFRGLFFRPGEAMPLEPLQQSPHLGK